MKKLLARLRRIWEFSACPHTAPHCLHLPVQKGGPTGPVEILHVHLCDACGLCVHFEVIPPKTAQAVIPLNRYAQPAPGEERWN